MTSLSFFFGANLEQSGGRIPDAESTKVMFSVIATHWNLLKLKTELKNLKHSSHIIALGKGTFLDKNSNFLQKNADIAKIKEV